MLKKKKVTIQFDYAPLGVVSYGKEINSFKVAGEDKVFYEAEGQVIKGQLVVWSDKVPKPVAVRYGWEAWVKGSLFNTAGLPASSFRTDNWEE